MWVGAGSDYHTTDGSRNACRRRGALSGIRAALRANAAGELSDARMLRTLVDHPGWQVAADPTTGAAAPQVLGGVSTLLVFSSPQAAAALHARFPNMDLSLTPPARGGSLFAELTGDGARVVLDAADEHRRSLEGEALRLLVQQAHAMRVEAALAQPESTARLCVGLARYDGFRVVMERVERDGGASVWTVASSDARNGDRAALVFTAPDCVEAWCEAAPETGFLERATVLLGGHELFDRLPDFGLPHILFNPRGPGVRAAFRTSLCRLVTSMG